MLHKSLILNGFQSLVSLSCVHTSGMLVCDPCSYKFC